jgi:hypothetical protein
MPDEGDTPLTDEELANARKGETLIANAVGDTRAPLSLREAIERERATARGRAPFWRRHRWILAGAASAAAALVAVALVLVSGSDGAEPSLDEVYAAAEHEPTGPAPATAGGDPPVLDTRVGALEFPDWRASFGWKAVGRRDSELEGRRVTTVYYRNPEGARLGYAVVAGDPLGGRPAGRPIEHKGDTYDVDRGEERTIVTWTQQRHTCAIVAPSAVPRSSLIDLAASRNV